MKKTSRKLIICLVLILMCFIINNVKVSAAELINSRGEVVKPLLITSNGTAVSFLTVYSGANATLNPGIIEYGKTKSGSTGIVYPFQTYPKDGDFNVFNFYPIRDSVNGRDRFILTYCLGHSMNMHYGASVPRVSSINNGTTLTDAVLERVTRVLIYGYDAPAEAFDDYRNLAQQYCTPDAPLMFATQVAVWIAAHDVWGTNVQNQVANAYLNDPQDPTGKAWAAYNTIVENVNNSYKEISFMQTTYNQSSTPIKLSWSETNQRFEATLTDTNGMYNVPKISYNWSDPTGNIYVEHNGNQITICANEATGTKNSPVKLTAEKLIFNGDGVLAFWQSSTDSYAKQPLGRIVAGKRASTYTYANVYTEGIKVRVRKSLVDVTNNFGDATVEGAVYGIYEDHTCTKEVARVTIGKDGYSNKTDYIPYQTYYIKEITASEGTVLSGEVTTLDPSKAATDADKDFSVTVDTQNDVISSTLNITKKLGETELDPEILLSGVQFELTLKSDPNQKYLTNISGENGICEATNIPYGVYTCKEVVVNDMGYKVEDFDVSFTEDGKVYYYEKIDESKQMQIEVNKQILLNAGEKTDAVVKGAVFTVYLDAECKVPYKDKNGNIVTIGSTDDNGYAISKFMRTGTYYLKETTFPQGIDPDAMMPGENVTYREKVYTLSYNNKTQGDSPVTVFLTVQNEPKRNGIEVFKEIGKTTNTTQAPLDKCEFTATLKSSIGTDEVFSRKCTAETDSNGYCVIEDLPYGEYVVEETKVSPISLKCDNFDVFVEEDQKVKTQPYYKNIVDTPKVMQIKMRKVDANRTDNDAPDFTQGDGVLKGAIYQIYRYDPQTDDYTEVVYEITVDHKDADGYWCAESGDLLVGKYMVKEKISYTEEVDGKTFNYSYAEGYLADPETYYFEQQPDLQTVERTYHYDTSKEEVIRGSVQVIKYDNILGGTDNVASKGAILRLTLDSNNDVYYDVTINENGYGEFVEEKSREKYYPYTIPYGKYTITEVKESDAKEHTSFFVQPENVVITKQVQKEYRIEADEPVEMYIQIQKTDKDTGANVSLKGAKFKVWNCQTDNWVSQITYPSGKYIDEFETNKDGILTLPHKLEAGEYIIYETQAPAGYYLEEAWRVPENEADLGNADIAGKYVKINKAAMNVVENTPANSLDLYYKVEMPNEPLKGKLEIFKTGEMLTDSTVTSTEYGEKHTPVYNIKGLEGVTYNIKAAEDIKSPDGNVIYVKKGTLVDTITTGEDGFATTKELYLGEYIIEEIEAPEGYLINTNIENVTLENEDTLTRIEITNKELTNVRQKLKLTFEKTYEDIDFTNGKDEVRYSVFGVYANQDIKNVEGNIVISKGDLVDIIKIEGEEKDVTSTIDLPEGKYYVQELATSYPYTINSKVINIELKYNGNKNEYITKEAEGITNTYESATLTLIKVSSSTLGNVILTGNELNVEGKDETLEAMLEDLKGKTEAEVKEYLQNKEIKTVAGVEYSIFTDEECKNTLYKKDETTGEFVEAKLVTNESGIIKLEEIPLGKYYLKETKAPYRYEMSDDVVEIDLTSLDKDAVVYRALVNDGLIRRFSTKTDIFTGEVVPNCTFEIKDEDGNVLLHSITNENGEAYISLDIFEDGKTYTYTEINAPEIYNLNTEPHEFVAKFDENGEWATELIVVENYRKESTVTLEKLDFADSTAIPNCKFELRSLETDFVVEGVTDENGIYVFENIPYGKYTYTELEAPEEYIIDTTPHEVDINAEEMKIQVTNEKAPETGDIQIVTMIGMLMISMAGLVYTLENKKRLEK